MKFYITFGQRYRRETHPVLGDRPDLPDGWLTIEAATEIAARYWLVANLDNAYAFVYEEDDFFKTTAHYHHLGELGDVREAVKEARERQDQNRLNEEKN